MSTNGSRTTVSDIKPRLKAQLFEISCSTLNLKVTLICMMMHMHQIHGFQSSTTEFLKFSFDLESRIHNSKQIMKICLK